MKTKITLLALALLLITAEAFGQGAPGQIVVPVFNNGTGYVPVSSGNPLPTTGSGGGGGAVTIASGGVASGAYSSGSIASGAYASGSISSGAFASGSISSGADVTEGTPTDTPCTVPTSATSCTMVAISKAIANLTRAVTLNATPSLANGNGVVIAQGGSVLSVTNPIFTTPVPTTTGGLTTFFVQPAASNNSTNIKNGAGQVYWVLVENNSATVNYLRFYNTASAPTCTSATNLVFQMQIPASTAVGGVNVPLHFGIPFATGIGICVTSGYATTDNTNATASAISLTIGYN